MSKIQPADIKEIAKAIAIGDTCYVHRYTAKITRIYHSIEDTEKLAAQEKTKAALEKKIESYIKIEKPSPEEQMVMMKNFLKELPDKSVRKQISNALNRNNPVRNFKQAVESDMELSQHWRNFNFKEYQRWISQLIIDTYNY